MLGNKAAAGWGNTHPEKRLTAQTNAGWRRYDCLKGTSVQGLPQGKRDGEV